jgi:hypothetical protein
MELSPSRDVRRTERRNTKAVWPAVDVRTTASVAGIRIWRGHLSIMMVIKEIYHRYL